MKAVLKTFLLFPVIFGLNALCETTTSSAEYSREQIEKLPKEDIWWTTNGENMLWSFKNLHTIFPTVTVHRKGSVKPLELNINNITEKFNNRRAI